MHSRSTARSIWSECVCVFLLLVVLRCAYQEELSAILTHSPQGFSHLNSEQSHRTRRRCRCILILHTSEETTMLYSASIREYIYSIYIRTFFITIHNETGMRARYFLVMSTARVGSFN